MKKLNMQIPKWNLNRWIRVSMSSEESKTQETKLSVKGIDSSGGSYDLLKSQKLDGKECSSIKIRDFSKTVAIDLIFHGHYNEPNLSLILDPNMVLAQKSGEIDINLIYNPDCGKWEIATAYDSVSKEFIEPLKFENKGTASAASKPTTQLKTGTVKPKATLKAVAKKMPTK